MLHSKSLPIDITDLRKELAYIYEKTGEFEINRPADSMEALIALLNCIHTSEVLKKTDASNIICTPRCASHRAFELLVEETLKCLCEAEVTNKWDYGTFSHHFYVNDILEDLAQIDPYSLLVISENDELACMEVSSLMKCDGRLHEYMRMQWEQSEVATCPRECPNPRSRKILRLMSEPSVYIINMIWKDFRPDTLKILQVFASIPYSISLDTIYKNTKPSVHVLKSLIYYSAGHYICAVRVTEKKLWYKIDDERGRIIGDGSWKALVTDSIKARFYPVGLFYEKSEARESNHISPEELIRLEREVLEESKASDVEEVDWECKCGVQNNFNWKICKGCNSIRSDINGWACDRCTFINESEKYLCGGCGVGVNRLRYKSISVECKNCGRIKPRDGSTCQCERSSKCKICEEVVESSCNKCYLGYECKICKEYIPKRDGIICVRCKGQTVGKKCTACHYIIIGLNYICNECTGKLWKCNKCELFNYPESEYCVTNACAGIKSFAVRNGVGNGNTKSPDKVVEVRGNGVEKQDPERDLVVKCLSCASVREGEYSFCVNCKFKTMLDTCKFCAAKTCRNICEDCLYSTKICKTCRRKFHVVHNNCPDCGI